MKLKKKKVNIRHGELKEDVMCSAPSCQSPISSAAQHCLSSKHSRNVQRSRRKHKPAEWLKDPPESTEGLGKTLLLEAQKLHVWRTNPSLLPLTLNTFHINCQAVDWLNPQSD